MWTCGTCGLLHGARSGGIVEVRQHCEQLGTHPRQPACLTVCVHTRVLLRTYVSADERAWPAQKRVVTTGTTAAAAVEQLFLNLKSALNWGSRQRQAAPVFVPYEGTTFLSWHQPLWPGIAAPPL